MYQKAILTLAFAAICAPAQAAFYYVNSSQATIGPPTSSAGSFRYLMQHTNYDQNIFNGVGSLAANNITSAQLGNVSQLNNRTFNFSLENRPGEGLIFRLATPASNSNSALDSTLAWGTFTNPVSNASAKIDGVAPSSTFNTISITAGATRAGSSMSFSNLAFTSNSAGLTLGDGAFLAGVASTNSSGVGTGSITGGGASGFSSLTQILTSDGNLGDYGWVLSGQVTGLRDVSVSGSAQVNFTVSLGQAPVTIASAVVPESSSMAGIGLSSMLLLRRRREG